MEQIDMMKLRSQRPSEFSLQHHSISSPDTEGSIPEEDGSHRGCCHIEDAKTKFGTFFFGLLLMAAGVALLYFGFRSSSGTSDKTSRDNKLLLMCGFISSMLGLFCFVVSILMFKDVPWLYSDNLYQVDDDVNS